VRLRTEVDRKRYSRGMHIECGKRAWVLQHDANVIGEVKYSSCESWKRIR
jgi:hypothetical protein